MSASSELESRFRVTGMDCAACATKIETATRKVKGVEDVSVSIVSETLMVRHSAGTPLDEIMRRVTSLGYGIAAPAATGTVGERPAEAAATIDHGTARGESGSQHDHPHDHEHDHDEHHDHGPDREPQGPEAAQRAADPHAHGGVAQETGPWWRAPKARATLISAGATALAFLLAFLVPVTAPYGFTLAMLVGLVPVARRAWAGLVNGSPFSIETLMVVAAIGAVIIGASEEAAIVVLLFLVGELLEGLAAARARDGIRALNELVPKTALVEEATGVVERRVEEIALGAIVLVRPGDRVAADGEIIEGLSAVNEAPVTGESVPVAKQVGDAVFAGTINQDGLLRIRVTAEAADNTIARIIELVERAEESKAPTERFIERFSRYYTPAIMVLGALVALVPPLLMGGAWSEWIYKGLATLLIGCPCALVISTPAAVAAALSAGARSGLLLKGGAVLEMVGRLDRIAFDKTGTLTEGRPLVTDLVGFDHAEAEVLRLAAGLEQGSSHPLALAILGRAEADGVTPARAIAVTVLAGRGVGGEVEGRAAFLLSPGALAAFATAPKDIAARIESFAQEGKTLVILVVDGEIWGVLALRDEARADAVSGLAALRQLGVLPIMLTGDTARTATAIAAGLGIEARAELLPEDKQQFIAELKRQGHRVGKVGDGINDAPALAEADVGIAMGGGTDIALETADAAILRSRVSDVAAMVRLSRATLANIRQNITVAIGLKLFFLATTVLGVTGLWPAILADTGATVLVTANAMRLLAWRNPYR